MHCVLYAVNSYSFTFFLKENIVFIYVSILCNIGVILCKCYKLGIFVCHNVTFVARSRNAFKKYMNLICGPTTGQIKCRQLLRVRKNNRKTRNSTPTHFTTQIEKRKYAFYLPANKISHECDCYYYGADYNALGMIKTI